MVSPMVLHVSNHPLEQPPNRKQNNKNTKPMKETLTTSHAASLLVQDDNATWTYPGALALVEYLEELESDCGIEIEFDRVAIRCDYAQYDSLQDWASDYFGDWQLDLSLTGMDDEQMDDVIREYIQDNGTLIEFDGGIIVSSF